MLGVLVQSNYGGHLRIDGMAFPPQVTQAGPDGSIMILIATDAPLSDRNLRRLAQRAFGGLARTGAALSNGSGDYALAFSTAESVRRTARRRRELSAFEELPNERASALFEAVIETTEEAILNSLLAAETTEGFNTMRGRQNRVEAISHEAIVALMRTRRG
jgi:D-aminopeptidase